MSESARLRNIMAKAVRNYDALLASNGARVDIGSDSAPQLAGQWVKSRMRDVMAEMCNAIMEDEVCLPNNTAREYFKDMANQ